MLNAVCCRVRHYYSTYMFRGICNVCYGARLSMAHQAGGRRSTSDTTRWSRVISAATATPTRLSLHHSSSAISSASNTTSQVNLVSTRNTLNTSSCYLAQLSTPSTSANCAIWLIPTGRKLSYKLTRNSSENRGLAEISMVVAVWSWPLISWPRTANQFFLGLMPRLFDIECK